MVSGLPEQGRELETPQLMPGHQAALVAMNAGELVAPGSELAAACAQTAELQGTLGKTTMEAEIVEEAVGIACE